jgi:hypothetical protein
MRAPWIPALIAQVTMSTSRPRPGRGRSVVIESLNAMCTPFEFLFEGFVFSRRQVLRARLRERSVA